MYIDACVFVLVWGYIYTHTRMSINRHTYICLYIRKRSSKLQIIYIFPCKHNEDARGEGGSSRECEMVQADHVFVFSAGGHTRADTGLAERFAPRAVDGPVKRQEAPFPACVILL